MSTLAIRNPIGRVYITNRRGGVSCRPVFSFSELEIQIRRAYRQRLETVVYADDPSEPNGRRVIGRVEKAPHDSGRDRWLWWCESEVRR